jgi:outer membrane protein TolC
MRFVCRVLISLALVVIVVMPLRAQIAPHVQPAFQFEERGRRNRPPEEPTGFAEHVVEGKLTISLNDAIRLALMNNTDIRIDEEQVQTAKDVLLRALGVFDPTFQGSFNSTRQNSPEYSQLGGGPPTLNQLSQNTQLQFTQNYETGTNFQASFTSFKTTSNSTFFFFSPAFFTSLSFTFTQPLLKGAGLFVNRAPIVIGQRGISQARANFEAEVNDLLLQVVSDYWNVIQAREDLAVQHESLGEAQKSYDHDKRALELGALPPLDIYRSESQVASRRVSVIQAEYALKQQENQLRRDLGADIDPNIRALDLNLTEKPDPGAALMSIDIPTALDKALNYRPELESMRQQLASDETNIRVARNGLEPSLALQGGYTTSGLNAIASNGNFEAGSYGSSVSQLFGFGFPTYSFGVTLSYPIRNRQAQAAMGDALSTKRQDLYAERRLHEQITQNVTNAVHQLEQSKLSMEAAKVALDYAQKTLEAEQHKYELGAETVFFVLEAQTELTQAEQNVLQAQVGYQNATAQVEHDTGGLLARFEVQITNLSH